MFRRARAVRSRSGKLRENRVGVRPLSATVHVLSSIRIGHDFALQSEQTCQEDLSVFFYWSVRVFMGVASPRCVQGQGELHAFPLVCRAGIALSPMNRCAGNGYASKPRV